MIYVFFPDESDDSTDECSGIPVVNLNMTPSTKQGPNVHTDISALLSTVLYKGLNQDSREFGIASYPLLGNCSALTPPQINPEIKTNLEQLALNQDDYLRNLQSQLAAGISALAVPLNLQYQSSKVDRSEVTRKELANFADPMKIFADVFHSISIHRRTLLLPLVKVGLTLDQLRALPYDDMLFGRCLAKSIGKNQKKITPPMLSMDFQPKQSNGENNGPGNYTGSQKTSTPNPSKVIANKQPQTSASGTLPRGFIKRKRKKAAKRKAKSDILQFVAIKSGKFKE